MAGKSSIFTGSV